MSLKICIPAIAAFLLAACGGDDNNASDPAPSAEADFVVESFGDLSVCSGNREGATAYVKDENNAYICSDGDWAIDTNADTRKKSSSSKDEANSSNSKDKAKSSSSRCEDCKDGANSCSSLAKSSSSKQSSSSIASMTPCKTETEDNCVYGVLVDNRDGQTYKTVKIGGLWWMAENLNYEVDSSFCYNDSAEYCEKYGRLYKWAAAVDKSEEDCGSKKCGLSGKVRGVCPEGWRLPNYGEWKTLLSEVGGVSHAGTMLGSQTGWNRVAVNGMDFYGFSALPAGNRDKDGNFDDEGDGASFWSASEAAGEYNKYKDAGILGMNFSSANTASLSKDYAFSVRCLQDDLSSEQSSSSEMACKTETGDNCEYGELNDDRDGQTYKTVKIGDQVWMAENLNYKVDSSFCYNDSAEYCEKYGRLYRWAAVVGKSEEECGYGNDCRFLGMVRGVCPKGWHLPLGWEWKMLFAKVGGDSKAGTMLKSQTGWNDYNGSGNGTDSYGFSAFPAGNRKPNGDFIENGVRTYFWDGEADSDFGGSTALIYSSESAYTTGTVKGYAFSVRCIQD